MAPSSAFKQNRVVALICIADIDLDEGATVTVAVFPQTKCKECPGGNWACNGMERRLQLEDKGFGHAWRPKGKYNDYIGRKESGGCVKEIVLLLHRLLD